MVLLLYSRHCDGSIAWAKYLHRLFTELSKHRGRLRVRHLPAEDLAAALPSSLPASTEREVRQSKLQLCLISPSLLHFLSEERARRNPRFSLSAVLPEPDRVLAVMLGVRDDQIGPAHRAALAGESGDSFSEWVHLEAKDHDLEFVQTVLYFSTHILNGGEGGGGAGKAATLATANPRRRSRSCRASGGSRGSTRTLPGGGAGGAENGTFHVHPKKVTEVFLLTFSS